MKNKEEKKRNSNKVLKSILVVVGIFLLIAIIFFGYATYELNTYNEKVAVIKNTPVMLVAENGTEFGETSYDVYLEIKDKQKFDIYPRTQAAIDYAHYMLDYVAETEEEVAYNIGPGYYKVRWNLVSGEGKKFGKVSYKCIEAIRSGNIDSYIAANKEEKETLDKYKEYIKPHRLKEIYFEMPEYKWICRFAPRF